MSFISISIDICGSTSAKARLRGHSVLIGTKETELYDSFQRQVLRVEDTFWTMLRSSQLDIERLFLIKSIGDEIWYSYDLDSLEIYDRRATVAKMIEALVSLQTKQFDLVAGPPEDPYDWENIDPSTLLRIDIPLKITIDVITDALDVGILREKYLSPHVASLLSPMDKLTKPVKAGDDNYINLCNRLGIASQVKAGGKVLSAVRSDYIGWEIDRFFRLTKAAIEGAVLLGPEILADFDASKLIVGSETETQCKPGWSISEPMIRVCRGSNSFTSIGNYILARRYLTAKEQKGVGIGCDIGIIYYKYQQNVNLKITYTLFWKYLWRYVLCLLKRLFNKKWVRD